MVGELARLLAVLRLASEEATGVLVEVLSGKAASSGGDVVLTEEQERAYQQTIGASTGCWPQPAQSTTAS
jgi:hypothetical protein